MLYHRVPVNYCSFLQSFTSSRFTSITAFHSRNRIMSIPHTVPVHTVLPGTSTTGRAYYYYNSTTSYVPVYNRVFRFPGHSLSHLTSSKQQPSYLVLLVVHHNTSTSNELETIPLRKHDLDHHHQQQQL